VIGTLGLVDMQLNSVPSVILLASDSAGDFAINASVTKKVRFCIIRISLAASLALGLIVATTIPAHAGLGGDESSIASDAAALQATTVPSATAESQSTTPYDVRSFVTQQGTTVREYAARSGPVFGVAWQGRKPPDLSVLLGSYYSEYTSASGPARHNNLHHAVIEGPNTVVVMGGHMGHIVGRAYVAKLAPSGVDAKAVVK
jgi:hypothetical protein